MKTFRWNRPEIAHIGRSKSGCHGLLRNGPLMRIEPCGYLYFGGAGGDCGEIFEKTGPQGSAGGAADVPSE